VAAVAVLAALYAPAPLMLDVKADIGMGLDERGRTRVRRAAADLRVDEGTTVVFF